MSKLSLGDAAKAGAETSAASGAVKNASSKGADKGGAQNPASQTGSGLSSPVAAKTGGVAPNEDGAKNSASGSSSPLNTVGKVGAAGEAAGAAAKVGVLAKMISFAHMMVSGLAQAGASVAGGFLGFIHGIVGAVVGAAQAVGGFFVGVGSAVAGFFGFTGATATVVGTTLAGGAAVMALTGVIAAGGMIVNSNSAQWDGALDDCGTAITQSLAEAQDINEDEQLLMNAKKMYSALKTFGLKDIQIAGVLANFQAEGSIDPTVIEAFYVYGGKHYDANTQFFKDATADLDAYTLNKLFPLYDRNGPPINKNAYKCSVDGKYYPGIGLCGWTGGGAYELIKTAEAAGKDWWDFDFQAAWVIADNAPTGYGGDKFWDIYNAEDFDTPEEAATWFCIYFEGNRYFSTDPNRIGNAPKWLAQFSSWTVDGAYGQSVIDLAAQLGAVSLDESIGQALEKCKKSMAFDNSSIAAAAISYAYPLEDQGLGNDGTELYQRVHKAIFPGDPWFQSCDRGVATAVRWSGSDDSFPAGATGTQYTYLMSSTKWEKIAEESELTAANYKSILQPGDVFITVGNGHILLYTGHELIEKKHGDAASAVSDQVSASFGERSPGCSDYDIMAMLAWDNRPYVVYRCVNPDKSETYKNAGVSGS